jgi:hypothetical protein
VIGNPNLIAVGSNCDADRVDTDIDARSYGPSGGVNYIDRIRRRVDDKDTTAAYNYG